MAEAVPPKQSGAVDRSASLLWVLAVAFALRVLAAVVVSWIAARKGKPCLFDDTIIYNELARAIVAGDPYRVFQGDAPHYALRTPGYPLFLAACRLLFGASLPAARVVQAGLGTVGVWLLAKLVGTTVGGIERRSAGWSLALVAAAMAAVEPFIVGMSALVLSEAIFVPLMLAGLWGLALLWTPKGVEPNRHRVLVGSFVGLAMGAAVLARPSWLLFVPFVLMSWVIGAERGQRKTAAYGAIIVGLAMAAIMAPWWVRNFRIHGRFVPTALWVGASLYDGVGPQANGESEMKFVEAPDVRSLGEVEQENEFRARSWASIKADPVRIVRLAAVKFGRFWSPWPNAAMFKAPGVALASAIVTIPLFVLVAMGAWDRRRDFRALVLLLGPILYFCALHMIFVSSIRYRIPGMVPALGLAAVGWDRFAGMAARWVRFSSTEGGPIDGNSAPGA